MTNVEKRLLNNGITLPETPVPVGSFLPGKVCGNLVFASGQTAWVGDVVKYAGKVGREVSLDEAYESAKICALRCIAELKSLANLDKIEIIRVKGYVNAVSDFKNHPYVINGASDVIKLAFGEERGSHARAAVGMGSLPENASVELEVMARIVE